MKKVIFLLAFSISLGISAQHFQEDFNTFPGSWSISSDSSSTANGLAMWHGLDSAAAIEKIHDSIVHDEWLISPRFFIPNSAKTLLEFDFSASNFWMITPLNLTDVTIHLSTDSGITWIPVWTEDTIHFNSFQWTKEHLDISTFQNDSVQIGIQYAGRKGHSFMIDNIVVRDADSVDFILKDINWYFAESKHKIKYYQQLLGYQDQMKIAARVENIGWDTSVLATINFQVTGVSTFSETIDSISVKEPVWVESVGIWESSWVDGTNNISVDISPAAGESEVINNSKVTSNKFVDHWDEYYQKDGDSLFGFFPTIDLDEDGIPDTYEVQSLFEVPTDRNYWFSSFAGYVQLDSIDPGIQYYNFLIEDSSGVFVPHWDGIFSPIPEVYFYPYENTENIFSPVLFDKRMHFNLFNIEAVDSLRLFYFTMGNQWTGANWGYSYCSYEPITRILIYQSTAGLDTLYAKEIPRFRPYFYWSGLEEGTADLQLSKSFPNPVKDRLTVEFNSKITGDFEVNLTNLSGEIVQRFGTTRVSMGLNTITLNLDNLATGQYFYVITNLESNLFGKVSVIK